MAQENTHALLDDILRRSGLYEKARRVLRDYAEKSIGSQPSLPGAYPKDIFDALRQAGLVDELLDAIRSAGMVLDEGTLRIITGGKSNLLSPLQQRGETGNFPSFSEEDNASNDEGPVPHAKIIPVEVDPLRRQLFLEIGKGKVFLSHLSEAFMEISQAKGRKIPVPSSEELKTTPEPPVFRYYMLHFYCNGQKFSTPPIPTSIEPDFPSLTPQPQYIIDIQPQNENTLAPLSSLSHSSLTIPSAFLADVSGDTLPGGRGNSFTPYSHSDSTTTLQKSVQSGEQGDASKPGSKIPPRPLLPTYHSAYFVLHVKLVLITERHTMPVFKSDEGEALMESEEGANKEKAPKSKSVKSPPIVTTELIGSGALDWRIVLSAKNGCINTLLPLAPAGVMRHQSIGSAGEMLPVGLLPISLSLLPVPSPNALLPSLDVRYSQQQLAMTYAERLKTFHQYSIAWYREFKSLHPSFASRYVRVYGECEEWGSGTIAGPVPLQRVASYATGASFRSVREDSGVHSSAQGGEGDAIGETEMGKQGDTVQGEFRSTQDRFTSSLTAVSSSLEHSFSTQDLEFPTSIRMLPLCSFITPLADETLIPTAESAARFVSLLPYHAPTDAEEITLGPPSRSVHVPVSDTDPSQKSWGPRQQTTTPGITESQVRPQWRGLASLLTCLGGAVQDHAVLLCSLFRGLALDAYVVIGTQTRMTHTDVEGHPMSIPLREEREAIWVMTRYLNSNEVASKDVDVDSHAARFLQRYKVVFWDPVSGKDYLADSFFDMNSAPMLEDGWRYKELHCVFSDSEFYACVAGNASISWIVKHIGFDFAASTTAGWKGMDSTFLSLLPHSPPVPLSPPSSLFQDVLELETMIEGSLKHLVEKFRSDTARDRIADNLYNLLREFPPSLRPQSLEDIDPTLTKWNTKIERIMYQALETYERNSSVSKDPLNPPSSHGTNEQPIHHSRHVQAAFKRVIPKGYVFQGFPICFSTLSPSLILQNLLNFPLGNEVIHTPFLPELASKLHTNQNVHVWKESNLGTCFALRVKVIPFPHDIAAVWVMIGAIRPNASLN